MYSSAQNKPDGFVIKEKPELLSLRQDNTVKADCQRSDVATFWREAGGEHPSPSDRPV